MKRIKNAKQNPSKTQNEIDVNRIYAYTIERDEQNSWKELPPNKANGNQKSLGHLKGAKTTAR